NLPFFGSCVFVEKPNEPPSSQLLILTWLTREKTSAREIDPCFALQASWIAVSATWTAPYDGGPKLPTVLPLLSFFQPSTIFLSVAMPVMSGAKFDTYEPGTLN